MSEWATVAGAGELAEGATLVGDFEGVEVLLVRHQGSVYAFENRCSHDGSPLAGGQVKDGALVCPHHRARFALADGAALCAPAYEPLTCFAVRLSEGCIQLRDERW